MRIFVYKHSDHSGGGGERLVKTWLIEIISASVVLSMVAALLPESGVKRSAMTALGFIFMLVLASPVISAINNGFSYDAILSESISQADSMGTDVYISNVVEGYKEKLSQQCKESLSGLQHYEVQNVEVQVVEDADMGDFGQVTWVKCTLAGKEADTDTKSGIDKIVIDLHGIHIGENEKTESYDSETEEKVKDILSGLLGIDREVIYVVYQ